MAFLINQLCLGRFILKMYKIELHLHTKYANLCGKNGEIEIVQDYIDAGYSGIAVTEHYSRKASWFREMKAGDDALNVFLQGYKHVKAEGERRGIMVYRGAEIQFDEGKNDYLIFNYPDNLLKDPEEIFSMGLKTFSSLARECGALLIQAHPCRKTTRACVPAPPEYIDGVEVFNPGSLNYNEEALKFAEENLSLIRTEGSDYHASSDTGKAGIGVDVIPADDAELVQILKMRNFVLLNKK